MDPVTLLTLALHTGNLVVILVTMALVVVGLFLKKSPAADPTKPAVPAKTGHPILDAARAVLAQATPANLAAALAALQQLISAHQAATAVAATPPALPPAPPKS